MAALLLAIIYLAFISLGLPDSLLGSAWPVMFEELDVPVSYAGIITTIISVGTIISSLLSDKLTRKFGAGLVTAVSVGLTACALFGFSSARSFWLLCVIAVPYGLGAGAIDAALNNYVALHYASRHMSWLHCFWGVGASISPYIMGYAISSGHGWRSGYSSVSFIQIALTVIIFLSLPLWKNRSTSSSDSENYEAAIGIRDALRIKGVKPTLMAFWCYCAFETTAGLWASTYLVEHRGIDSDTAATFASLFYLGITFGRFLCGFITDKLGDRRMIRIGVVTMLVGTILIFTPALPGTFLSQTIANTASLAGLVAVGLGCAPVYPCIIHATPINFGKENSHAIVGIQMASAYTGSTLMPPVFGIIADFLSPAVYPVYLAFFAFLLLCMSEKVNRIVKSGNSC